MTKRAGDEVVNLLKDYAPPAEKRRKRIPPVSAKRLANQDKRDACRRAVLKRANGRCEYAAVMPEVDCGAVPGHPALEVDEIRGGSARGTEMYDPERCIATCAKHHIVKGLNKREVIRRLEGLPHGKLHRGGL